MRKSLEKYLKRPSDEAGKRPSSCKIIDDDCVPAFSVDELKSRAPQANIIGYGESAVGKWDGSEEEVVPASKAEDSKDSGSNSTESETDETATKEAEEKWNQFQEELSVSNRILDEEKAKSHVLIEDPLLHIRRGASSSKGGDEIICLPNRFGIKPGLWWDGVDRSNGFERKRVEMINRSKADKEQQTIEQLSGL